MIKRFFELQERVLAYNPDSDTEMLKKAYTLAANAHLHQTRANDDPYITHPLAVAATLADMQLDDISIAGGLLHDVVEDTHLTTDHIRQHFSEELARIIFALTKIAKMPTLSTEDVKAETLRRLMLGMSDDIRVILIKLADRLHNVRTLSHLPSEKRRRIALETLEIFAPIANRLGIWRIKEELEDLCFPHAYPEKQRLILDKIGGRKDWAWGQLEEVAGELRSILNRLGIPGEITYRIKREISIYRKLIRQEIDIDHVYDLLALRVITDSVEHCYTIMGEIHQRWTYIASRWRDFISAPKPNGYRSIHTTIIGSEKSKFEIQIRTGEMHSEAESGIAAHWRYKEGPAFLDQDKRLDWLREIVQNLGAAPNSTEFLSQLKSDLSENGIIVLTPKGKAIELPVDATPIDFAYAIHGELGDHCQRAIVNEVQVPLKTRLSTGDTVSIISSPKAHPSRDWLTFVASSRARKRIQAYFNAQEQERQEEQGRSLWVKTLRDLRRRHRLTLDEKTLEERIHSQKYPNMSAFLRDLGRGKRVLDRSFLEQLMPELRQEQPQGPTPAPPSARKKTRRSRHRLVQVEGLEDIEITLARCCNPIRGDIILGGMTQTRGLVVHQADCPNLRTLPPSRLIYVDWVQEPGTPFPVRLSIQARDRAGLLNAITSVTTRHECNIRDVQLLPQSHQSTRVSLLFEVLDVDQLRRIVEEIRSIKGVERVERRRPQAG